VDIAVFKSRQNVEAVARLDSLYEGIGRQQRSALREIATLDETKEWEIDGCHSMGHWLARRYGHSAHNANLLVKAAHSLKTLPLLAKALENGELGVDKVVQIARFAKPDTEAELIEWGKRVTVATIREKADLARKIEIEKVRSAEDRLHLAWQLSEDHLSLSFWGELPAGDGVTFIKAINRQVDQMTESMVLDDSLTPQERHQRKCGAALVELAMNSVATDADTDRATVVIHSDMKNLDHNSQTYAGMILHPTTAARLRCDGRIEYVFSSANGEKTIGIGRASREIPAWLWRQLSHRDNHRCQFPGCDRKAFLQGHHIWPWELGGPTDLDNLVLVCHHHHKLVHEGGWRVWLEDEAARWADPRGSPVG
jgi:Domain of unknown function (DUF222)/HNH endonuclease